MHRQQPPIAIDNNSQSQYYKISNGSIQIICGRNNSGKSFILKKLYRDLGRKTSFLGPNRYQNFDYLGMFTNKRNKSQEYDNYWINQQQSNRNIDNSPWNLQQAIAELDNDRRNKLFSILNNLLHCNVEIRKSDPKNDMSVKFISVDGYNLSYSSSGFRLITSILTSLFDTDYENFLIDEPELGVSPEVQGALSEFLLKKENRDLYFPHIKKLVIATHSPVFLDKQNFDNNYYVEKKGNFISINNITTVQDLNRLQFFLLGNRFETLFLPSIILLVEGISDYKFINQVMNQKYSDSNISVIQCNGDSKIREYLNLAKNMFGDIKKSPYHDRIFTILDKVHGKDLKSKLIEQGVKESNVVIWDNNGIEYYYPKQILENIFGSFNHLELKGDIISANGISKKKNELVDLVCSKLSIDSQFNDEFHSKLINKINSLIY